MAHSKGHRYIPQLRPRVGRAFLYALVVSLFLSGASAQASPVRVEVFHSQNRYEAGGTYPFLTSISVSKGWYLHGTEEDEKGLIPTRLSFWEPEGINIRDVLFPLPEFIKFEYTARPIQTFSGQIPVYASLRIGEDTPPGEHTVRGRLSYQACSVSTCLPPAEESFTLALTVVTKGTPTRSVNRDLFLRGETRQGPPPPSLWLALVGFFLGGLALNLTPCIYPLIPITVSYFTGKTRSGSTLLQAGLYLLGLAVTNSSLGLWAAVSGRLLGSILQNPLVVVLMAALFLTLAMSFFGFWEFRLPPWLTRRASKRYGGYFGSFFMGLTLGIVAAPCLGPFILGLLTYVARLASPWAGFLSFFVLSLGLGLPLAVLAYFSGAVDRLPLSGDWMVWIRKLMGWILVAMAVYMGRTLIPWELGKSALTALVAVGASLHLCWFDRSGLPIRGFLLFKRGLGVVLVAAAFVYFGAATHSQPTVLWVPYEEPRMALALHEKKPLILDVYAEWCVPCRAMDRKIFADPEVVALSRKAVMMRLDLTRRQPSQEELLRKYGIKGVPTIVFFDSAGVEVRDLRAEAYLEKDDFLARFKKVLPDASPSSQ